MERESDKRSQRRQEVLGGLRTYVRNALAQAGTEGFRFIVPEMKRRESLRRWSERVFGSERRAEARGT